MDAEAANYLRILKAMVSYVGGIQFVNLADLGGHLESHELLATVDIKTGQLKLQLLCVGERDDAENEVSPERGR